MGRGKRSLNRCLFRDRLKDRLRFALSKSPRTNRKGHSESIGGTSHAATAGTVENMRVNHGCPEILVAQEVLNRSNIIPVLDQVSRERMAEGMAGGWPAYLGIPDGLLDGALHDRFVQMMTPLDLRARVATAAICRKHPLPTPFPVG